MSQCSAQFRTATGQIVIGNLCWLYGDTQKPYAIIHWKKSVHVHHVVHLISQRGFTDISKSPSFDKQI